MIGREAYIIYSIFGITAALYFPVIKHNTTKVSANALYFSTEIQLYKVYIAIVGNVLYRVSHKMNPCAV